MLRLKSISQILGLSLMVLATLHAQAGTISACEEIKREIGGRKKNAITASRLAKTIDRITQQQSVLSEEDLTCVIKEAEALDREDVDGQLAEQLFGFSQDQAQLFTKIVKSLDNVQRAHVQKMIDEARKLREEGNG